MARVFPARAGMIRPLQRGVRLDERIPRESGDDPDPSPTPTEIRSYSPRERG
mgnify:CR=1 FL=1